MKTPATLHCRLDDGSTYTLAVDYFGFRGNYNEPPDDPMFTIEAVDGNPKHPLVLTEDEYPLPLYGALVAAIEDARDYEPAGLDAYLDGEDA